MDRLIIYQGSPSWFAQVLFDVQCSSQAKRLLSTSTFRFLGRSAFTTTAATVNEYAATFAMIAPRANGRTRYRSGDGRVRATMMMRRLVSRVAIKTLCFGEENVLDRR